MKNKNNYNIILLDKEDIKNITDWGKSTIDYLFAYEEEFPAIKIGKKYLVEQEALKAYFSVRRVLQK